MIIVNVILWGYFAPLFWFIFYLARLDACKTKAEFEAYGPKANYYYAAFWLPYLTYTFGSITEWFWWRGKMGEAGFLTQAHADALSKVTNWQGSPALIWASFAWVAAWVLVAYLTWSYAHEDAPRTYVEPTKGGTYPKWYMQLVPQGADPRLVQNMWQVCCVASQKLMQNVGLPEEAVEQLQTQIVLEVAGVTRFQQCADLATITAAYESVALELQKLQGQAKDEEGQSVPSVIVQSGQKMHSSLSQAGKEWHHLVQLHAERLSQGNVLVAQLQEQLRKEQQQRKLLEADLADTQVEVKRLEAQVNLNHLLNGGG